MYEIELYASPPASNASAANVNQTFFPFMPILTHSQQTWLETITSIFGWLSLVCTLFLLLTFGTFKMKRQYPANFTFYFCIAAFATDAAFVVGSLVGYERLLTPEWFDACYAQGNQSCSPSSCSLLFFFLLSLFSSTSCFLFLSPTYLLLCFFPFLKPLLFNSSVLQLALGGFYSQ
jgi:hypothetical protein